MTKSATNQTKNKLHEKEYVATREELRIIDAAIASIDAGDVVSEIEIRAAFAKFRSA
jgi:hypothetical protein